MQSWPDQQSRFAAAVLDPAQPVPEGVIGRHNASDGHRFAVYRNNVMVSLVDALQARFPATCRLVGDEFFRATARAYAGSYLPDSPLLMEYGSTFPEFIADFEPATSVPYLADVARLEVAWSEAYHAADSTPLELEALQALSPEVLAGATIELHPSVRLLRSSYPVAALWAAQQQDIVTPLSSWEAQDVLVVRPDSSVSVHTLAGGTFEFLAALINHGSLENAAAAALLVAPHFDVGLRLVDLISLGAAVGFTRRQRRL